MQVPSVRVTKSPIKLSTATFNPRVIYDKMGETVQMSKQDYKIKRGSSNRSSNKGEDNTPMPLKTRGPKPKEVVPPGHLKFEPRAPQTTK